MSLWHPGSRLGRSTPPVLSKARAASRGAGACHTAKRTAVGTVRQRKMKVSLDPELPVITPGQTAPYPPIETALGDLAPGLVGPSLTCFSSMLLFGENTSPFSRSLLQLLGNAQLLDIDSVTSLTLKCPVQ